jgi:hypothetical protein
MAISRPFLLALIGLALLGATVFAVGNARNSGGDDGAAPAAKADQATPAPAPTPAVGPEQLIESAFTADVKSASFDAKLTFTSVGERNLLHASGAVEDNGPKAMPEVDVQVRAVVPSMDLNERAGFVTTGDRAWFTRGAAAYAVPQGLWSQIAKARESGKQAASESDSLDLDAMSWLRDAKQVGTEQVDGVQTTHVQAGVDSAKAVAELAKAVGGQVPVPNAAQRLRQSGLKNGRLDVWVGQDKVLRRMTLSLSGRGTGGRPVDARLSLTLSGVNEPQDVAAPAHVKRGMPGGLYGQVANGVLSSVAEDAGLSPKELHIGVPVTNSHVKAERAVADNQKVVIFFQNPRALDDQAVAQSVRSLDRRTKNVVVLSDDLRNSDRYGSLLEDLEVSQAPAIVVIGRSGNAELVEGYVDADSLVQVVADAR